MPNVRKKSGWHGQAAGDKGPRLIKIDGSVPIQRGNSIAHHGKPEGQNVLYADGHTSYEKTPDVGVNNDNMYTFWPAGENPTEQDIRGGKNPTSRSSENDAKSPDDSFLAI